MSHFRLQATSFHREFMRGLYLAHNRDEAATCAAYLKAEIEGRVIRKFGDLRLPPEDYAEALLRDGIEKGWLK